IAANFQFRAPLQFDEAHAAIASNAQLGMIAIMRDDNTGLVRCLDDRSVIACRNLFAVNGQLFCHGIVLRSPPLVGGRSPQGSAAAPISAPHSVTSTGQSPPGLPTR